MNKLTLLVILFFSFGCTQNISNNSISISGNSEEMIGKMIYLKDYDHFDYMDENYMIDSCKVDDNRDYKFELPNKQYKLVTLSGYNNPLATSQIFGIHPEHYTFSFCANFFAMSPTIFLEPHKSYEIPHWDSMNKDESLEYGDKESNFMRNYYRGHNYWRDIDVMSNESGIPLVIKPAFAWEKVKEQRDSILNTLDITFQSKDTEFKNYMKSEIYLGAINDFLNWYSLKENDENHEVFYQSFMDEYTKENWHSASLEYFKLTERYISHQLNKKQGLDEIYHEPDEKKIACAEKYAGANIRDKYIANLLKIRERSKE